MASHIQSKKPSLYVSRYGSTYIFDHRNILIRENSTFYYETKTIIKGAIYYGNYWVFAGYCRMYADI